MSCLICCACINTVHFNYLYFFESIFIRNPIVENVCEICMTKYCDILESAG